MKRENLTIIADFCEALRIEAIDVKYLFDIAKCILIQDTQLYWELFAQGTNKIKFGIADEYMTMDEVMSEEMFRNASNLFSAFRFEEALPLLQKLAASGYSEAYALLYWIYCDSSSYKNDKLAKECLRKGYELEDTITTMLYAMFYDETDYELGKRNLPKLKKMAEEGNIFAEYTLGIVSINDICGSADYYSAVNHFMKAHTNGFYRASWSILLRYKNGDGIFSKDWIHASLWAEEVLKWGIEYRGWEIAYMYLHIEEYGCSDCNVQNEFYKKAIRLWKKLVDSGSGAAATNLGWMHENGKGVEKSQTEGFKYYQIAADMGDDVGQCNLAFCYENGIGTVKDMDKAVTWYKKASEQGLQRAKEALTKLGIC